MAAIPAPGSNNDCYFYYYSSCTKGDDCPFRHCQAALGTETVCSLWREGRCSRSNCKFRHMESRMNRTSIPCYWEHRPGGCRKPHCVFLHQRSKYSMKFKLENQRLILPVSTRPLSANPACRGTAIRDPIRSATTNSPSDNYSNYSDDVVMSPHPVEPIVVTLDVEESDSESVSSTPMKSTSDSKYNSVPAKRNLMENLSEVMDEKSFYVKTLEQLRMEKIHKESEHFYKSDDTPGTVIPNKALGINRNTGFLGDIFSYSGYDARGSDIQFKKAAIIYKPGSYPPKSEFTSVSERVNDQSTNGDSNHLLAETERDLRSRLVKRKSPSYLDKNSGPPKKVVNLRNMREDPLNFKIKTLDEIRKEKENKSIEKTAAAEEKCSLNSPSVTNSLVSDTSSSKFDKLNSNRKFAGKIKIKRMSNEFALSQSVVSQGKRKEFDGCLAVSNGKYLKTDSSSSSNGLPLCSEPLNNSVNEDRPVKKPRRPIIKRMSLTLPPLSSSKPIQNLSPEAPTIKHSIPEPAIIKDSPSAEKSERPVVDASPVDKKILNAKEDPLVFSTISVTEADKKTARLNSVDEFEKLLLNDGDINLDDMERSPTEDESEVLLLEIEQLLDS